MNSAIQTGGESGHLGSQPSDETSQPIPDCAASPTNRSTAAMEGLPQPFASSPTRSQTMAHHHSLLQAAQSLVNIIVIALFIITFTVQPFRIPSESMEPTLLVGDFLLVNKNIGLEAMPHVMAPSSTIHRGDLIVFHYPIDSSLHLVKRVIGLPGDRLHLRDGHVYINDHLLPEPYAIFQPSGEDSYRDNFPRLVSADPGVDSRWWIQMHSLVANGELMVPPDEYFVLGDNRNNSEDSRYWGFVPRDAIVGKPFLVYFSLNDADAIPGQSSAAALPASEASHENPASAVLSFARWDRTMRIIY